MYANSETKYSSVRYEAIRLLQQGRASRLASSSPRSEQCSTSFKPAEIRTGRRQFMVTFMACQTLSASVDIVAGHSA